MDDRIASRSHGCSAAALIGRIRQAAAGTYGRPPDSWAGDGAWEPDAKIYASHDGCATYGVHTGGSWRTRRIGTGAVLVIPGGCRHRYHTNRGITLRWMHVPIIDDELQRRLLAGVGIIELPPAAIAGAADALAVLDAQPDLQDLAVQATLQSAALAMLAKALQTLPKVPATGDGAMVAVREWCAGHCRRHPDRKDVARMAGLSVPQLHRRFTAAFGETPSAWLERCRLAIAQRLLRTTAMSVHEVAAAAGYEDPYYFSRVFTRRVGLSPRRFASAGGEP